MGLALRPIPSGPAKNSWLLANDSSFEYLTQAVLSLKLGCRRRFQAGIIYRVSQNKRATHFGSLNFSVAFRIYTTAVFGEKQLEYATYIV